MKQLKCIFTDSFTGNSNMIKMSTLLKRSGIDAPFHTDAVQGFLKEDFRYSMVDMASILNPNFKENMKKSATIRFYEYPNSERKMLITIQADGSKEEMGAFYVLASEVEDLGEYLNDLVNGVLLPKST